MTSAYDSGANNKKKIIWFVVIIAVVGVIVAGCALSASANQSPDAYIERTYSRTPSLDEANIDAFTTTKSVSTVQSEISGQSKPVDTKTSSDGSVWLQYSDDIVALFPYNGGTKIMADDYDRVHRHYYGYVGGWWSSSPPGRGWGRGGGSGGGGK